MTKTIYNIALSALVKGKGFPIRGRWLWPRLWSVGEVLEARVTLAGQARPESEAVHSVG